MRTNKVLALVITALFAVMSVVSLAMAGEFPQEAAPGNSEPQIYLVKKIFDICNPADDKQKDTAELKDMPWTPGEEMGTGGSTPWGDQTIQYAGCKDTGNELRYNQYAFPGEQILELVVVRDLNGAEDIVGADVVVDGELEAKCDDVTAMFLGPDGVYNPGTDADDDKQAWFGHDVSSLLGEIPAKKGPEDSDGVDGRFDKIYECILTVEPQWYGMATVNIQAEDQTGTVTTDGISQQWFWDPAIEIDLSTNDGATAIQYESGVPGQTVYSTNKLVVTNLAEGGAALLVFMAADDLTDPTHTAVKCPVSNVLDVDTHMESRCKIGTMQDQQWYYVPNKNTKMKCNSVVDLDPVTGAMGDEQKCYGAKPVIKEHLPILMTLNEAECEFRLTYPVPCVGSFTQGLIHVIVRVV